MTPHYLPPYSPNLNLIERSWKLVHENVLKFCIFLLFSFFHLQFQLDA
ncbi:TPA: hypothetical protein JBA93_02585 [Legionella pneumophila subsp. pneumophila]|nr:hypothetical protein [Legionella pneumophila subsp. pneumophila]